MTQSQGDDQNFRLNFDHFWTFLGKNCFSNIGRRHFSILNIGLEVSFSGNKYTLRWTQRYLSLNFEKKGIFKGKM